MRKIALITVMVITSYNAHADMGVRIPTVVTEQAVACSNYERWKQEQLNIAATIMPEAFKPQPITAKGYCKWLLAGTKAFITGSKCKSLVQIIIKDEKLCISIVNIYINQP